MGVTYANLTGKPIQVNWIAPQIGMGSIRLVVNGIAIADASVQGLSLGKYYLTGIVPSGANYYLQNNGGGTFQGTWLELR